MEESEGRIERKGGKEEKKERWRESVFKNSTITTVSASLNCREKKRGKKLTSSHSHVEPLGNGNEGDIHGIT